MVRSARLVTGLALAAVALGLLVGCSTAESAEPAETSQRDPSDTTSSEPRVPEVGFSARFAGYEAAPEPDGDPSKVVWPAFVTDAGADVQRLYEFQVTNGELMRYMPCFCGCGGEAGHRSNRDCYIIRVNADGSVVFDSMAPT